jgi:8-oxo-dGTP diphosphatase
VKLATLCYVKKDGKTLMIHRVKKEGDINAGKWNGLGGKFNPGETPEACVCREVWEESGLSIVKPCLKGFITFPGFAHDEDWYVFVFIANQFSGVIGESGEGVLEWIEDSRIHTLNLWEGDHIFLPWLEGERFFSARFVYDQGRLTAHDVVFYPSVPPGDLLFAG